MTLGPESLVLCSGTIPRDTSFLERLEAASGAGYDAISLWGRDYARAGRDGHSDAEMRVMLDDHGLVVAEVDPAWWWTPGAAEVHIPADLDPVEVFRYGEDDLLRMAEAMGARSLNAADVLGGTWARRGRRPRPSPPCATVPPNTGSLVHLEWLAWSRIPDLDDGLGDGPPGRPAQRRPQRRHLALRPHRNHRRRSCAPCPPTGSSPSSSTTRRDEPRTNLDRGHPARPAPSRARASST